MVSIGNLTEKEEKTSTEQKQDVQLIFISFSRQKRNLKWPLFFCISKLSIQVFHLSNLQPKKIIIEEIVDVNWYRKMILLKITKEICRKFCRYLHNSSIRLKSVIKIKWTHLNFHFRSSLFINHLKKKNNNHHHHTTNSIE